LLLVGEVRVVGDYARHCLAEPAAVDLLLDGTRVLSREGRDEPRTRARAAKLAGGLRASSCTSNDGGKRAIEMSVGRHETSV
jgi:hypothetical protein